MQSLLNFFRSKSPLRQDTQISEPVKTSKPSAVKARLEARTKRTHDAQEFASKQERAANRRSEILKKLNSRLQKRKDHLNIVKQRKASKNSYWALKLIKADRKRLHAIKRATNALQQRQSKAKRHNLEVIEKSVKVCLQSDNQKEDLIRKIESR
jgi:acyl-CoA reductase-like NAD-dependent aldehyde dehydrogenase